MDSIETHRKQLNKQQTELRRALTGAVPFETARQLFLAQHASLHSTAINTELSQDDQTKIWSFEDAILYDLDETHFRRIPKNCEHSIVWCIWHLARIEDTAMNILVANNAQVFTQQDWAAQLGIPYQDCGNEMRAADVHAISQQINLTALRSYRVAVGRQTREIVAQLEAAELKQKVDPARIQRVLDAGAITEAARGITDYWRKRDIAGLLLMPASRHNLVHLNEALKLKKRVMTTK